MNATTFAARPGVQEVVLERIFAAKREVLWRAMTEPHLVVQWWGPSYLSTTVDVLECRPGGAWRFVQSDPDGTEFVFHGFHHAVDQPSLIVKTFEYDGAPARLVTLETTRLIEAGGMTTVSTTSVFQSVAQRDRMVAAGMQAGYVEGMTRLNTLIAHRTKDEADL